MTVLTVNLNSAIDRTLFIKDFQWGQTIRSTLSVVGMGGKAADASWILSELRVPNLATGFAAGDVGRQMVKMLCDRGGEADFVWVEGETRTNIVVVGETAGSQSTLIGGGLVITPEDVKRFYEKYHELLRQADSIIIGGSVPPGVEPEIYTRLIREARRAGIPVVFDASGPGLKAGLEGSPTVVKPNIDEISSLAGYPVRSVVEAYTTAHRLMETYGTWFVVTLGSEGALAVLPNRSYLIPPLKVAVVSTAGAGDAVLAGLAFAYAHHKPIEEGLRLGFAAAAAVCLTPATADCRRQDVERLLPDVRLEPYQP
jgi:1-phosphofructokinase family hexose kinase